MAENLSSIRTADGRTLEYLQFGPVDGPVVLFHLGTPNAAAEYSVVTDAADALGLRLISYSRPGYGESTERPGRRVADAIGDVTELLDQLGVAEFRAFGWSGGGPHALACAALLPQRCRAAALLAGVAPYPARGLDFLAGMGPENVEEFGAALAGIEPLTDYLEPLLEHFGQLTGDTVADGLDGILSGVDRAALTGRFAEQTAVAMRRAVAHGIAGWRDDDLAFVQDWGFDPAEVRVPVAIWQGGQDRMVPFAHGQWLAAEIPTARAHLYADEGHLSLIMQAERILTDLLRLAE
ncbi:MAG TPA: alpha/beta hydrolase [Jatrophihabitans sp.]|jgi:pimeloyl-ACP methyl ester carboxylesterase|nr:alpha/beta hydrolase [Jatrophihabitans sp.]